MKRISILGSTGSIGRSALDIVSRHSDEFRIAALTAGNNIALLDKQIRSFSPEVVAVAGETAARELRRRIGKKIAASLKILAGQDGIAEAAAYKNAEFVLSAIVGAAGLINSRCGRANTDSFGHTLRQDSRPRKQRGPGDGGKDSYKGGKKAWFEDTSCRQ